MVTFVLYLICKALNFWMYQSTSIDPVAVLLIVSEFLLEAFIIVGLISKNKDENKAETKTVAKEQPKLRTAKVMPMNMQTIREESIFETECPFVEGTVRAEYWHKVTGR